MEFKRSYSENRAKLIPGASVVTGILFIGVLSAGLGLSLFNPALGLLVKDGGVGAWKYQSDEAGFKEKMSGVLKGEWSEELQHRYEEGLLIGDFSVHLWTALRYLAFREGRSGVLVGEENWLFTTEEFIHVENEEKSLNMSLEYILNVRDALMGRDIELIVALIPSKARVYSEKLGRYTFPTYAEKRYHWFLEKLHEYGVWAPDLYKELVSAKKENQVFLRTDTHWNPFGAEKTAESIAGIGAALLTQKGADRADFYSEVTGFREYRGDLLSFIPLGTLEDIIGPKPDRITVVRTNLLEDSADGSRLFGEVSIPVTLIGTSFSKGENWNFDGFLKEHLAADVLQMAREGKGPYEPMNEYLRSDTFINIKPSLIIWEIPERYLIKPPIVEEEL